MSGYDKKTMAKACKEGPWAPRVKFTWSGETEMFSNPEGAHIVCWLEDHEGSSHISITTDDDAQIADVIVRLPDGGDLTVEPIKIATWLYWAWWRCEHYRKIEDTE
jgi:hypothetical protein